MASERAKDNKTLSVECSACHKAKSTEVVSGILVVVNGRRKTIPVCDECASTGWQPPAEITASLG